MAINFLLLSTLKRQCPNCQNHSLYKAYLKPFERCPNCDYELGKLRADDGPIWLTMFIVAHIIIPLALILEREFVLSYTMLIGLIVIVSIALVLTISPFAKALFMAILWRTNQKSV